MTVFLFLLFLLSYSNRIFFVNLSITQVGEPISATSSTSGATAVFHKLPLTIGGAESFISLVIILIYRKYS